MIEVEGILYSVYCIYCISHIVCSKLYSHVAIVAFLSVSCSNKSYTRKETDMSIIMLATILCIL